MASAFSHVIGVGLPKTGTTTLAAMFRQLGYRHAPCDVELVHQIAGGERSGLAPMLAQYNSFEDWPWPLVYRDLPALPSKAQILTRRASPEIWLESLRKHR